MATTREEGVTAPRTRPGGRSARVRSAVLSATLEELVAVGYATFTCEGVAQRAGVNKTTIYRRWGGRENLLLDAMLERGRREVPIPDTGSLRGDLFEYGWAIATSATAPEVEAIARAVASIGDRDPKLAEARRTFWKTRLEMAGAMVERAVARGEVPSTVDVDLVVETVIAPIYFRLLMTGQELDDQLVERLAGFVAAGASA